MKLSRKRRGRPPLNRPKIDKGTEELQQKRRKIVSQGRDPSLAESLLGIFYAHEMISVQQYDAGQIFREIGYRYEPCLGYVFRQRRSVLAPRNSGDLSDLQDEKRSKLWRGALNALKQSGHLSYQIVMQVLFYDRDLFGETSIKSITNVSELRFGLDCLDHHFKGEQKAERGKRFYRVANPEITTTFPKPLKPDRPHGPL